jgi:hypothetical protein
MTERAGCLSELADILVWKSVPWLANAACRGMNTWVWFYKKPGRDGAHERLVKARAKGVCSQCPVRWRCLAEYIEEPFGVFGGYDEDEREVIRNGLPSRRWHDKEALQAWLGLDREDSEVSVAIDIVS